MKRLFGNGNGEESEKLSGNPMGMGIGYKIRNGIGREWKCKKPFSVIFTSVLKPARRGAIQPFILAA